MQRYDDRKIPPIQREGIDWPIRRKELLSLFGSEIYGITPEKGAYQMEWTLLSEGEAYSGLAVRRVFSITIKTSLGAYQFPFVLLLPKGKSGVPVFDFICIWSRKELDCMSEVLDERWPAEEILRSGYGSSFLYTQDVDTDCDDGFQNGILRIFDKDLSHREGSAMATIGAWAFGASRVLDVLETIPEIDVSRVAVIGHSRGGKTALWAGAQDERFSYVISNDSGCTGAALARGKEGERIANINRGFPYWFCENYKRYNEKEEELPIDQHMLLALCASRLLYVASASEDEWADPYAEYTSLRLASKLWENSEESAFENEMPDVGKRRWNGALAYHLREGKHGITRYDWKNYMEFWRSHIS